MTKNPFSKEQIKNYLLLYAAIVVIMILFYFLNTLLSEQKQHEKRLFDTNVSSTIEEAAGIAKEVPETNSSEKNRFRLLEKGY